jgi:hypothetical protein
MPSVHEYDRGHQDIEFQTCYGIPYPIKGIMYCTLKDLNILFRDAKGDYYYWHLLARPTNGGFDVDEYLGRFRGRSNMSPEEFVKSFKSVMVVDGSRGLPGEDIEELQFIPGHKIRNKKLVDQQEALAELHARFRARRMCSCTLMWSREWN